MPRVHPIFTGFTTGEVTPLLYGRVDFAKYASSCRTLYNMMPRPHGPAYRRPGTRFVAEVKNSSNFTRLIPFEFSTTQAYVIEAGHQYFRFYMAGGRIESPPGTPVEIATPYSSGDLLHLKFAQSADTLYIVHPNHAPRKLVRFSHTSWSLSEVNFLPPPTFESGTVVSGINLTLSAATGLGVTLTAATPIFLEGDIGRMVTVPGNPGRAIIRALPGAGPTATCTADVVTAFSGTGPFSVWTFEGSPFATCTPSPGGRKRNVVIELTLSAFPVNGGLGSGWRVNDLGRYVRINGGVCRITEVATPTLVRAEVLSELNSETAAPPGAWSLEDPSWGTVWGTNRGFPRAIAFHDQRLVLAGSAAQPQTFWGSAAGLYESFGLGPDDDDAYEFTVAANKVNVIHWILPTGKLLMGTASTEFSVQGSPGAEQAAITPNSVDVDASTSWGSSATVAPVRIGQAALFVSRTGTELREMIFSVERDAYIANDMLLLADHLTEGHVLIDMTYQQHPNSTVWCVRSDGALLSLTYQREHDVVGWGRHITGPDVPTSIPAKGKFESVTTIPHWNGDRDVTWVVVNRTINGVTKRYVEYLDDVGGFYGSLGVDSALTYSGPATNVLAGLDHLEGETVQILGNGAVYPEAVVTGGQVTVVGNPVTVAEVGLRFNSALQTMRPEVPVQGTSQGLMKHWSEIIVRCDRTLGMFINGQEQPFRVAAHPMDAPPPLFTGDVVLKGDLLRDRDGIITIEQRQPLPLTVVAIFGTLAVGE